MPIAVLSDTHNHLPPTLLPRLASAEEIWHLGDICRASVLEELRAVGPPLTCIRGNCDSPSLAPETQRLTRGRLRFYLIHIPLDLPPADIDAVLHGHTHVPRDEVVRGVRFLNPGTVGKPNHGAPPSFAWLEVEGDRLRWTLELL